MDNFLEKGVSQLLELRFWAELEIFKQFVDEFIALLDVGLVIFTSFATLAAACTFLRIGYRQLLHTAPA